MSQRAYKENIRRLLGGVLLSAAVLAMVPQAFAATVRITPATSSVSAGDIVTVKAVVDTEGRSINNAEGVIRFPSDLLEVISVSKGSSIFSLWVEDPKYSNAEGTVRFNGGVPNPGYSGAGGEMLAMTFRAKKASTATIAITDAAVRQNDGLGTDILTGSGQATVFVTQQASVPAPAPTPTPKPAPGSPPSKLSISSPTHPDPGMWYAESTATFSWKTQAGATSIQTLVNKKPDSIPTTVYDASVSQRTVTDIADGVSYFHLRARNSAGWGPTSHYKVQIDTVAPEKLTAAVGDRDFRNVVTLSAADATSGIASYSLQIDGDETIVLQSGEVASGEYVLPMLGHGAHTLAVTAFDKAGNKAEASVSFTSREIPAPKISVAPERITRGDHVAVRGTSAFPKVPVEVTVSVGDGEPKTHIGTTNDDGSFALVTEKLNETGVARVSARLAFSDKVRSPESNVVPVNIDDLVVVQTSKTAIYFLSFAIPAVLLLLLLVIAVYIGWHKFFGLQRRIRKEAEKTAADAHEALTVFKIELHRQLNELEMIKGGRGLNEKEEKIYLDLQENVDKIDRFLNSRLRKLR